MIDEKFYAILKLLKSYTKPKIVEVERKELVILPGVFDPCFFDSRFLAEYLKKSRFKADKILDIGTGCGIQAIIAASKADKVTAIDINPVAIRNAKINIELHELGDKIETIQSDLFEKVKGKYDLIIFNPPFFAYKPKNIQEKSITDYKHHSLKEFFHNMRKYLAKDGKILLAFSDIGDINLFNKLIEESKFQSRTVKQESYNYNNYFLVLMEP